MVAVAAIPEAKYYNNVFDTQKLLTAMRLSSLKRHRTQSSRRPSGFGLID
jgi:hypothetical protein